MCIRDSYNTAPHFIYLPEVDFDPVKFISDIKEALSKTNNVIVAVSEGIHDASGAYVTSSEASNDQFGHQQLSGAGKALEFLVKEHIGVKVRSVEINVLPVSYTHLSSSDKASSNSSWRSCFSFLNLFISFDASKLSRRSLAAASSIRSIALSGRNLSFI